MHKYFVALGGRQQQQQQNQQQQQQLQQLPEINIVLAADDDECERERGRWLRLEVTDVCSTSISCVGWAGSHFTLSPSPALSRQPQIYRAKQEEEGEKEENYVILLAEPN